MAFALQLQNSLRDRHSRVADEFAAGDSLEAVLSRHLLAVEDSAETELLTSILLLDASGRHLFHGAAPNLPNSYCEAINGTEIGPEVGSCGTAAFTGRAVYVTDIAKDPLWKDHRHLALPHGLRACWSTPIRNDDGLLIGTFAIYHPTPRSPTPNEVESIRLITDHVAQAIMWGRSHQVDAGPDEIGVPSRKLKLVCDRDAHATGTGHAGRLDGYAAKLDRYAEMVGSQSVAAALKALASDCRKLVDTMRNGPKVPKDEDQS